MNKYLIASLFFVFSQAFSAPSFFKKLMPGSNRVKPFIAEENWKTLLVELKETDQVKSSSNEVSLKRFNTEIFFKTLRDEASLLTDNPSKMKKHFCLAELVEIKKLELKKYGFSQTSRDINIAQTIAAMIISYCKGLFKPNYSDSLILNKTLSLICAELARVCDARLVIDVLIRHLALNQECFCACSFLENQEIYICPQCNAIQHYSCLRKAQAKSLNSSPIWCAYCKLEAETKNKHSFVFIF